MTAPRGPQGICPNDIFLLKSGKRVSVIEWLSLTKAWHCRYLDMVVHEHRPDEAYIYLRHEFLLRYGQKVTHFL